MNSREKEILDEIVAIPSLGEVSVGKLASYLAKLEEKIEGSACAHQVVVAIGLGEGTGRCQLCKKLVRMENNGNL